MTARDDVAAVLPLAVCHQGQCCSGWCVDEIGVHNVSRGVAEGVAREAGHFIARLLDAARAEAIRDTLSTIRLHGNPRYREAIANTPPPDPNGVGVSIDELIDRLGGDA